MDREGIYPFPHKLIGFEKESGLKHKHLDSYSDTPRLHFCGYTFVDAMLDLIYSKFFISLKLLYVTQEVLEYFLSKGPDLERLIVVCGKKFG